MLKGNFIGELRTLQATRRVFIAPTPNQQENGKVIWEQPIMAKTIHWTELYQQLRKQIPNECYHVGCEIVDIDSSFDKANITLANGRKLSADFVICADGTSSIGRSKIYPNVRKKYAYIAWRGIASHPHYLSTVSEKADECFYYYGTADGHLVAYNIINGNKKQLNWLLYQRWNEQDLPKLLTDKNGIIHKNSLLPGTLAQEARAILHQHAKNNLPSKITQLICETPEPFVQVIYSLKMPSNIYNRLCFLGDAGAIYFPHIGSGSAKAIEDAFSLASSLSSPKPIDSCLKEWNEQQLLKSENLHQLSQAMGLNLVLNPPRWSEMDSDKMSEWWANIISGKTWYFTSATQKQRFFSEPLPSQNKVNSSNQEHAHNQKPQIGSLRAKL